MAIRRIQVWKKALLIIVLLLITLFPISTSFASNSGAVTRCNNGSTQWYATFPDYGTYLFLAPNSCIYADSVAPALDEIYFVNAALGNTSNPTQTFGLSFQNANITLPSNGIQTSEILTNIKIANIAQPANVSLYYSKLITEVVAGGNAIFQDSFITSLAQFKAAIAPQVFWNSTGQYLEVKDKLQSDQIQFIMAQTTQTTQTGCGSNCGGCGYNCGIGGTTQISTNSPPAVSSTGLSLPVCSSGTETGTAYIKMDNGIGLLSWTIQSLKFSNPTNISSISNGTDTVIGSQQTKNIPVQITINCGTAPGAYTILGAVSFSSRGVLTAQSSFQIIAIIGGTNSNFLVSNYVIFTVIGVIVVAAAAGLLMSRRHNN